MQHIVRVGTMGLVGRFASLDRLRYPRGTRVVVRTVRGLECAEVLTVAEGDAPGDPDGDIIRRMTLEDELLAERLSRRRDEALEACTRLLVEHGAPAVLLDVEHLLDGRRVYFYFLGEVPAAVEQLTDELASTYDAAIEFKQFSTTLLEGCGPGCGTEEAKGQGGCASCTSCAVASACKK
jgi:cell fate regulator YaaT (PSP1 superfamily)